VEHVLSNNESPTDATQSDRFLDFFYEKGPSYQAVHADGFVVSPNAKGVIAVTFYSERLSIPKHVRIDFAKDNSEEEIIEGKDGVFRQMEVTTFFDAETAEELRDWLKKAISAVSDGSDDVEGN
jgi:hypothetical protein